MPKGRVESFSDCVIAFAITVLILDIHLQDVGTTTNSAEKLCLEIIRSNLWPSPFTGPSAPLRAFRFRLCVGTPPPEAVSGRKESATGLPRDLRLSLRVSLLYVGGVAPARWAPFQNVSRHSPLATALLGDS